MKNYKSYISALAVLTLASCDPMHDVYEELDKDKLPVNNKIEYTLVKADYKAISESAEKLAQTDEEKALAKNILSKEAFNDTYVASEFVPALLAQKFPQLGFTSTAQVTYNVTENVSANVLKLEGLVNQPLVLADYQAVMGEGSDMDFFSPLYPADLNLPKAVAAKFADVTENGVYYTQYDYITSDPVKDGAMETLSAEDLEDSELNTSNIPNWAIETVVGPKSWMAKTYNGANNIYAEISAFGSKEACESWLISPALDVPNGKDISFNFDLEIRFYTHSLLEVFVSDNYNGDYKTANWVNVTSSIEIPQANTDNKLITMKNVSLNNFEGKKINIAFVYKGDDSIEPKKTTTYRIDNLRLQENTISYINPVYTKEVLVERYNGSWSVYKFGTVVSADDYVTMGAKGSFKDQATANALLPIFMGKTYAYAKEGDTRTVVYKVGSAQKVDEYVFTNGIFVLNNWIKTVTEQYVQDGKKWIFDPSISFDLNNADFVRIHSWVKENKPDYIDAKYPTTTEWYFGANSKFNNFEHTTSIIEEYDKKGDNEFEGKDVSEVMNERMIRCINDFVLEVNYKDKDIIKGIDTYFVANYIVRNGAVNTTYSMKFKLVGKGQFEYVEGPIKK